MTGVVRRKISGENLYEGVEIDYKLGDLSLDDIKNILVGELSGKYSVTLGSGINDNVFLFWSGHGTQSGWKWKDSETLTPEFARNMFSQMKFRKMFAVIETCYSGAVAQGCTGIPGLLMMTAANGYEPSKADGYDDELQVYLTNSFTSSVLSRMESNPNGTLYQLYLDAFDKTLGSHVTVFNGENYGNLYLNGTGEYLPDSFE